MMILLCLYTRRVNAQRRAPSSVSATTRWRGRRYETWREQSWKGMGQLKKLLEVIINQYVSLYLICILDLHTLKRHTETRYQSFLKENIIEPSYKMSRLVGRLWKNVDIKRIVDDGLDFDKHSLHGQLKRKTAAT